jgi:hypothetical protein
MTSFDNREKAEENKYAHDKETEFLIYASYHKTLAEWSAKKMKLDTDKAEAYKKSFVEAHLGMGDTEKLLVRIKHDFAAHHITNVSDREIREEMHALFLAARHKILKG